MTSKFIEFFKRPITFKKPEAEIVMVEGIHANWFYHMMEDNGRWRSLCDRSVLSKKLPLSLWGHKSAHINERYCNQCLELYRKRRQ